MRKVCFSKVKPAAGHRYNNESQPTILSSHGSLLQRAANLYSELQDVKGLATISGKSILSHITNGDDGLSGYSEGVL